MFSSIVHFFNEYFVYILGAIIQLFFILLPINLKNWDDDAVNICTYVCIQGLAAGIIFIVAPWFLESDQVSSWTLLFTIGLVMIIATFRVIVLIPLEFTYPMLSSMIPYPKISFQSFLTPERWGALSESDFVSQDGDAHYNAFRERLLRVRATSDSGNTSILEQLIEEEASSHRE
jgi:hypothetical protein